MSNHVCGAKHAKYLDNSLRKKLHNPYKIFGSYIKKADTVCDIGCGPGTFTVELADMVGSEGSVIAVDLQQKMLDMVGKKAHIHGIEKIVRLHKCNEDSIGFPEPSDVIICFFMVHEIPDANRFLEEAASALKPGGYFFLVEPRIHVSKKVYDREIALAAQHGLEKIADRKVFFSRAAVLQKKV